MLARCSVLFACALLLLVGEARSAAPAAAPVPARLDSSLPAEWRSLSQHAADVRDHSQELFLPACRATLARMRPCAQAVCRAIEAEFPGSVVRASSVHSVHVLRARQELLELELDGEGHRVLLSDADPDAFWPLPELLGTSGNTSLQARKYIILQASTYTALARQWCMRRSQLSYISLPPCDKDLLVSWCSLHGLVDSCKMQSPAQAQALSLFPSQGVDAHNMLMNDLLHCLAPSLCPKTNTRRRAGCAALAGRRKRAGRAGAGRPARARLLRARGAAGRARARAGAAAAAAGRPRRGRALGAGRGRRGGRDGRARRAARAPAGPAAAAGCVPGAHVGGRRAGRPQQSGRYAALTVLPRVLLVGRAGPAHEPGAALALSRPQSSIHYSAAQMGAIHDGPAPRPWRQACWASRRAYASGRRRGRPRARGATARSRGTTSRAR